MTVIGAGRRRLGRSGGRLRQGQNRAMAIMFGSWILLAAPPTQAENLVVLPANGQNVTATIATRARSLVMERLAVRCPDCWLLDHVGPPTASPMEREAALKLAQALGAQAVVAVNLAHHAIGRRPGWERGDAGTTTLTVTIEGLVPGRFPVGRPLAVQRSTSGPPAVLHDLADHVALVLFPAPAGAPAQPGGAVAAASSASPRRWFLGGDAGVSTIFGAPTSNTVLLPRLGLFALRRTPDAMVDLRGDYANESATRSVSSLGIGVYARAGQHWFAGCVARWVWQALGGRGAAGPVLQPTVGLLIPFDMTPLRIDVGYAVSLFTERELDRLIVGSGGPHRAHGPVATLGIIF